MSVLTKVFVVLLTILSIALSMFVIAAFAQQENWKQSAEDWRAAAIDAQAKSRHLAASAATEQQLALARHQEDLRETSDLRASVSEKEREIAKLERLDAESQNQLTMEQGQVTAVTEHNTLLQAALDLEKEFTKKTSRRNSELVRRNVDLNDRVKELTANVAMAASRVKALKEQIKGMADTRMAGATQIPGGSGIVQAYTPSVQSTPMGSAMTSPIRGEVTEIKNGVAGISVGSADGVAHGMKFLLYRSAPKGGKLQYLGTLRITRVEANQSAGTIEEAEGEIRPGDTARDLASFALRG